MELTPPFTKPTPQTTMPPVPPPPVAPAPVAQPSPMSTSTKFAICLLAGLLIGGGVAAAYFLLLVPLPEPVVVEKIVIQQATTTEQVKSLVPAKTYNFRTIQITSSDGATTTLSTEDAAIAKEVEALLKKDTDYSMPDSIILSSSTALVRVIKGGDSGGYYLDFIVDLASKKLTDKFTARRTFYLDQGTFVSGDDDGLRYYSYGATSSVKLLNSNLTGNQTYTEYEGPMGGSGYQIVATTTNSVTLGVFDNTKSTTAVDVSHFEKVGERMFIIR